MKGKLGAFVEIIRYPLFPIPIVATLPGVLIASGGETGWRFWCALVTALLGYFAGMMKNDYFHRDLDAKAYPDRPIPSGRLSVREVFWAASSLYMVCVLLGFLMNWRAGLLVILLVMISHLYNAIFKGKGVAGSISLPLGIGLLSIFGSLAVSGSIPSLVWYAAGSIALFDLGTHIITTFKDIDRDRELGIMTTPLQIGVRSALLLSASASLAAFAVALIPLLNGSIDWHYTVWMVIAFLVTALTRAPLMVNPNEKNGYLALKGAMVSSISFFPAFSATVIPIWKSALVILPLFLISSILLNLSRKEV